MAIMPGSIHGGSELHFLNIPSQISQANDNPENAHFSEIVGWALQEEL